MNQPSPTLLICKGIRVRYFMHEGLLFDPQKVHKTQPPRFYKAADEVIKAIDRLRGELLAVRKAVLTANRQKELF